MTLYRKWRSRSFEDLYGQEHVVRTLRNAVRQGRVAHAYLFTGPRGTGKTSTARILAKAVNCLNPREGNPCNECEMCMAANEGRAIDVVEIDAASNTSVENVRDLRERVAYAAGEGRYKVYIVDEVHRLSGSAFDAFLKTLEEPPPHVIFVFASTEPHKVPATITSRCQRFDFRRISTVETLARLRFVAEQETVPVNDGALQLVAQQANGSLRDALGLLEQVASYSTGDISDETVREALGLADARVIGRLTACLLDGEVGSGLSEFERFVHAGGDPRQLLRQFVDYWRALLLRAAGAKQNVDVDPALVESLQSDAARLTQAQVVAVIRTLTEQEFSGKYNIPSELPFELGYVQAGLALKAAPVPQPLPPQARHEAPPAIGEAPPAPEAARPAASVTPPKPAAPDTPASLTPTAMERDVAAALASAVPGDVESSWPAIVASMRTKSKSLQAVLRSGHLMRVDNGEMTIGFEHEFHRTQLSDVKRRRVLEEVIKDVTGVAYRVSCVKVSRQEIEAARGASPDDDGFIDEVSEMLRQYHAREIQNGDT